jgi:hypothetical protein
VQIDLFVLDRLPQPLDEHVVAPGAAAIHADANFVSLQHIDEARGGKLRSLVGGDMGLHAPGPVSGSLTGSPDSRGYIIQLEYVPFGKLESFARPYLNVRLGLQYTGYSRFNGGGSNYDGSGRSASDNNTLFGFFWFLF